ncbi:hypothetical protein AVEN_98089-1 [Araneus ventricosus]|uniref:Uncharacterized protein n=1 Tax=Araneus ventricosus TaxID=182803 RepID=A0A4Y2MTE1_ARAVE|nr:hypothetical protein AVEN_98089-1 [Araneus ventricosus]
MLDYFEKYPQILSGKVDRIFSKDTNGKRWEDLTSALIRCLIPDSNFSLQQACYKFVMTRVQSCHKFVMTRVQACGKLTKASKSPWDELAASLH